MPIASYNSATKTMGPRKISCRYRYGSETERLLTKRADIGRIEDWDDSGKQETRQSDILFR